MNAAIVDAIRTGHRLRFAYNGKVRIAEPQCDGIGTKGTELLRVHQIAGGSQREPLFDVARISGLVVLDETFVRPGPKCTRDDSAMRTIHCQLQRGVGGPAARRFSDAQSAQGDRAIAMRRRSTMIGCGSPRRGRFRTRRSPRAESG